MGTTTSVALDTFHMQSPISFSVLAYCLSPMGRVPMQVCPLPHSMITACLSCVLTLLLSIASPKGEVCHHHSAVPHHLIVLESDSIKTAHRFFKETTKKIPVVLYCSTLDCQESQPISTALIQLGFKRLLLFPEGFKEWTTHRLSIESGPYQWEPNGSRMVNDDRVGF